MTCPPSMYHLSSEIFKPYGSYANEFIGKGSPYGCHTRCVYSGTGAGRSELPMSATTFHVPSGCFL
jgi:hypothetical protein